MKRERLFDAAKISDQKRLARGEQWLLARSLLRAWHRTHSSAWEVMTLAGAAPQGEFQCVRELMPDARIVAVDKSEDCLQAAREAGADEVIGADVADWSYDEGNRAEQATKPLRQRYFDVINLDLCGGATQEAMLLARVYKKQVRRPGVLMLSFSYGRDVVEFFKFNTFGNERLAGAGVPEIINARVTYVLGGMVNFARSVILYMGNQMPMCSVVVALKGAGGKSAAEHPCSFVRLMDGDFELAVTLPNVARLYDCPQERIEAIRRKQVAAKAVATRRERAKDVAP